MKQRIDKSQLMQLTPDQQEKLRAWWRANLRLYDVAYGDTGYACNITICVQDADTMSRSVDCLPLLSIGQCIQLLNPYGGISTLVIHCTKHGYAIFDQDKDLSVGKELQENDELIDVLFQAVKEIL